MFYLLLNGEQHGPYSLEQIHALWADGSIPADVLCWGDGMAEWMPVDVVLRKEVQASPTIKPSGFTLGAGGILLLDGKELAPSSTLRRSLAAAIDYGLIFALVLNGPVWMGFPKDPAHATIGTVILAVGVILKDWPFRGRSLGRLLTGSYLIDLSESQLTAYRKSARRNASQFLWLFGWLGLLFLFGAVIDGGSSPMIKAIGAVAEKILPLVILGFLLKAGNSFSNPTGQGVWDVPFYTCVMNKK